VREGYLDLARKQPSGTWFLDASKGPERYGAADGKTGRTDRRLAFATSPERSEGAGRAAAACVPDYRMA